MKQGKFWISPICRFGQKYPFAKFLWWVWYLYWDVPGETVPGGSWISQYARVYAIEALTDKKLMKQVWDWRLAGDNG